MVFFIGENAPPFLWWGFFMSIGNTSGGAWLLLVGICLGFNFSNLDKTFPAPS